MEWYFHKIGNYFFNTKETLKTNVLQNKNGLVGMAWISKLRFIWTALLAFRMLVYIGYQFYFNIYELKLPKILELKN